MGDGADLLYTRDRFSWRQLFKADDFESLLCFCNAKNCTALDEKLLFGEDEIILFSGKISVCRRPRKEASRRLHRRARRMALSISRRRCGGVSARRSSSWSSTTWASLGEDLRLLLFRATPCRSRERERGSGLGLSHRPSRLCARPPGRGPLGGEGHCTSTPISASASQLNQFSSPAGRRGDAATSRRPPCLPSFGEKARSALRGPPPAGRRGSSRLFPSALGPALPRQGESPCC